MSKPNKGANIRTFGLEYSIFLSVKYCLLVFNFSVKNFKQYFSRKKNNCQFLIFKIKKYKNCLFKNLSVFKSQSIVTD